MTEMMKDAAGLGRGGRLSRQRIKTCSPV